MAAAEYRIHPAVGIARVGNSPNKYFVGPEAPGVFDPPEGGYKEDPSDDEELLAPQVKRQAARFRVYAYGTDGQVLHEVTAAHASVTWSVHLANKKGEWDRFQGRIGEDLPLDRRRPNAARNADVADRESLIIDPGSRSVTGPNQSAIFDGGAFLGIEVPLGEIRTDADGRLLVLGGFGTSAPTDPNRRITNYANNDRWHDDTSDGPVTATVTLADGTVLEARPSWVIVGPPDYAPAIPNFITMYDTMYDVAVRNSWIQVPGRPSFTQHIYPVLARTVSLQWINVRALGGHGPDTATAGHFPRNLGQLASNAPENAAARRRVFEFLRDPELVDKFRAGTATAAERAKAVTQAEYGFMPSVSGDDGDARSGAPGSWLTLTRTQYGFMRQWSEGDFEADWTGPAEQVMAGLRLADDDTPSTVTPDGLDRAALEAASGGSFFPGIEAGWIIRNPSVYMEPFRFDHSVVAAGDLTKRMAVPWQADFFECQYHWWPWQRPDDVLALADFERLEEIDRQLALLDPASDRHRLLTGDRARIWRQRASWARSLPNESPAGDMQMVAKWPNLGFVVSHRADGTPFELRGSPAFVESEMVRYENLSMAEYFHLLVNVEDHPDFALKARELAMGFLAAADYSDPHYAKFEYSPQALDVRMDWIYDDFVAGMEDPHWLDTGDFGEQLQAGRFSDAAVIENLRQKAPFNLVDGAWLQNILHTGPCSEVEANLFAIWADEAGNGKTELNHCNVYDTLLRSVNIYLPPITSSEFVTLDFLPSAFDSAVFQLSVGLFPQDFLPELLGMTLYLEWEATPTLTPTVRMLQGRRIDPHFYRLHVAIDNIASGHGALAKQAVKLYLDDQAEKGGDAAVQSQWARVWNGYVTWATTGTFGGDLVNHLLLFDGKLADQRKAYAEAQMVNLISRKAPAARKSHGRARLGGRPLNELFDDPPTLMKALLNDAEHWMDPAEPRDSRFLRELISFSGPMYKVFTEPDVAIILDWLESLRPAPGPGPGPGPDIGQDMKLVLEKYADRGRNQPRHRAFSFPQEDGTAKPVAEWFAGPPEEMMAAMARSEYVHPGSVVDSTFFTEVIGPEGLMSGVLDPADEKVIESWVAERCPQPGAHLRSAAALQRALAMPEPLPAAPFATRRLTIGQGSVH